MRASSRVSFGCCYHEQYVTYSAFQWIKEVVSLPPADYYIRNQEIWYDVPPSQVVQGQSHTSYRVKTDFNLTESMMIRTKPLHLPMTIPLRSDTFPSSALSHITIHAEESTTVPFSLFPESSFCDAEVHIRIREVVTIWDSKPWVWMFREIQRRPQRDLSSDKFLYFTDPPVYQIELFPPSFLPPSQIQEYLDVALPRSCYWPSGKITGEPSSSDTHRERTSTSEN